MRSTIAGLTLWELLALCILTYMVFWMLGFIGATIYYLWRDR